MLHLRSVKKNQKNIYFFIFIFFVVWIGLATARQVIAPSHGIYWVHVYRTHALYCNTVVEYWYPRPQLQFRCVGLPLPTQSTGIGTGMRVG